MSCPKLSIIVPCYNSSKFIDRCLTSIQNQDLKDFECILIDDGSSDDTVNKIRNFSDFDPRFKLIENEHHGCAVTRNSGLDIATAEYIGFVDSDDWIEPDLYTHLIENIEKNNVDMIKYCYSPSFMLYADHMERYVDVGFTWSIMYRRSAAPDLRFDENIVLIEDLNFAVRLFNIVCKCLVIDDCKYHYEDNPDSVLHKRGNIDYKRLHDLMIDMIDHCDNICEDFKKEFYKHIKTITGVR